MYLFKLFYASGDCNTEPKLNNKFNVGYLWFLVPDLDFADFYLTCKRLYSRVCISRHKYYLSFHLLPSHIVVSVSENWKTFWTCRHNKLFPNKILVTLTFWLYNLLQTTGKKRCDISSWRSSCQLLFMEVKFRKNYLLLPQWNRS